MNYIYILIGGLEHFLFFPYIGNFIIPTDYFSEGGLTTNQFILDNDDSTNPRSEPWWYIYLQNWMFGVNVGIHIPTPWFAYGVAQPPTRLTTYILYIYTWWLIPLLVSGL